MASVTRRSTPPSAETKTPPGEGAAASSRGDEARRRILDAAIAEFAAHGYRGASTRNITAKAGVNLGALTYYFGGKPSLYRAALDDIAGHIRAVIDPMTEAATTALADPDLRPPALRAELLALLDRLLDLFQGRTSLAWRSDWSVLLSRAEFEPPEGDPYALREVSTRILAPCAGLLARLLGRREADEGCRLAAVAVFGQVLAFRTVPDGQLPIMGWDAVDGPRRDAIRHVVHASVTAFVDSQAAPPGR